MFASEALYRKLEWKDLQEAKWSSLFFNSA